MACILKLPNETKGIVSFTTPESREVVPDIRDYLNKNRKDWFYLLHHNWHPAVHNDFFDSSLCNSADLMNSDNCLNMDCCNFSPNVFHPSKEKAFDVLYVTRAVTFKRINMFYSICKELLKRKPDIKILFICTVPEVDCDPPNPKQIYLDTFTREERKNFLALFFDYDYPFTVSREFLAHFYRSSKVFLHTTDNERHSRVCSYAWASGIPVVGYSCLATILPSPYTKPPYFYPINNDREYVRVVLDAIQHTMPYDDIKYYVHENFSKQTFKNNLRSFFQKNELIFNDRNMYLKNLDFRLGRHCLISLGDNSLPISIPDLMEKSRQSNIDSSIDDLELHLSQ